MSILSSKNEVDIRGIILLITLFNRFTGEVAIRVEIHMTLDIAWLKWRGKRGKAVRETFLVYRMVTRKANVEHEVKPPECRDDAYITNRNASTSIRFGKGSAGFGSPQR
jgi:hypothetical protein